LDLTALLKRADETRTRNRVLETIPGSGHHDNDRDWRGTPNSPQARGLPRVSEHIIVFISPDEYVFVGIDAERADEALQKYHANLTAVITSADVLIDLPGTDRKLFKVLPKRRASKAGETSLLVIPATLWNDILVALYEMKIGVTGLDLGPEGLD